MNALLCALSVTLRSPSFAMIVLSHLLGDYRIKWGPGLDEATGVYTNRTGQAELENWTTVQKMLAHNLLNS